MKRRKFLNMAGLVALIGGVAAPTDVKAEDAGSDAPLRFSDYLKRNNGDGERALRAALGALFASGGKGANFLDLEGKTITISSPVTFPNIKSSGKKTIANGVISPSSEMRGKEAFCLDFSTFKVVRHVTLQNIAFDCRSNASAIKLSGNYLDVLILDCYIQDAEKFGVLDAKKGGHKFVLSNSYIIFRNAKVTPSKRNSIGIDLSSGDAWVTNSTIAYARHGFIGRSHTYSIDNSHVFQGSTVSKDDFTAGFVFTGGNSGSAMTNTYLDKCFILCSNEDTRKPAAIGGITINGTKGLWNSKNPNDAWIVVRNKHRKPVPISRFVVTSGEFTNYGGTVVALTRVEPSEESFDYSNYSNIHFGDLSGKGTILHAEPCFFKGETKTDSHNHTFDLRGIFPFAGRVKEVWGVTPKRMRRNRARTITSWGIDDVSQEANTVTFGTAEAVSAEWLFQATCDVEKFK